MRWLYLLLCPSLPHIIALAPAHGRARTRVQMDTRGAAPADAATSYDRARADAHAPRRRAEASPREPLNSELMGRHLARRAALGALLSTTPAAALAATPKPKPGEKLDEQTAKRYRAIYAAKSKMDPEQQKTYMQKICDLGILGPSIL
eukprot:CAMPEP_0119262796 /NCGR_PEP_ID=MMETSP1329-20130426/2405_1 /TAXON_ID=114041 /ORGANISM="Genus nov. species nov., Strain RCC1024" /LENGTH=147 /DNA_ID=CAMNT_0007262471 /DNA_START=88 /DNA_END=528 /DNA_ORIENTATION=+